MPEASAFRCKEHSFVYRYPSCRAKRNPTIRLCMHLSSLLTAAQIMRCSCIFPCLNRVMEMSSCESYHDCTRVPLLAWKCHAGFSSISSRRRSPFNAVGRPKSWLLAQVEIAFPELVEPNFCRVVGNSWRAHHVFLIASLALLSFLNS